MGRSRLWQEWLPFSFGRRISKMWRSEQPWVLSTGGVPQSDEKRAGGILLNGEVRMSLNDGTPMSSDNRRVGGIKQLPKFLFKIVCSLLSLLWYLIPRRGVPVRKKAVHELHALSYLDALRGYGSLIIFTGHTMSRRWGWLPDIVVNTPGLQFPFRGGHTCLDIFFFISGYALTYRVIGFMQTKKHDKVLDTLASSVLRRYLRLFLPVVATTFVTMLLIPPGVVILPTHLQEELTAYGGNLITWWLTDLVNALDPFAHTASWWHKGAAGSHFLEQFWSINTEFRSSMMLFCFCMATCKMPSAKRKVLIYVCMVVCLWYQVQYAAIAFFGMLLAERRQQGVRDLEAKKLQTDNTNMPGLAKDSAMSSTHTRNPSSNEKGHVLDLKTPHTVSSLPSTSSKLKLYRARGPRKMLQRIRTPLLIFSFLFSFVVVRDPRETYKWDTFPHNVINFFMPPHWAANMKVHFHMVVGVVMMLYPVDQLSSLQLPLRQPFSQYLGELSFGIYAVHYTVRFIVWEPRYLKWLRDTHGKRATDHFFLLLPGYLGMMLCVLWAADLFRRMDMQVVKLCAKLEAWAFN